MKVFTILEITMGVVLADVLFHFVVTPALRALGTTARKIVVGAQIKRETRDLDALDFGYRPLRTRPPTE